MDILFKREKSKTNFIFRCHQNDVANFCAGDLLHNFLVEPANSGKKFWGAVTDNEEAVDEKDILKELLTHATPSTMFFAADLKGGDADTYLFPHCKDKTFYMEHKDLCKSGYHLKVECTVSPYYKNRNSGHMVRHMNVVTTIEAMAPVADIKSAKRAVA